MYVCRSSQFFQGQQIKPKRRDLPQEQKINDLWRKPHIVYAPKAREIGNPPSAPERDAADKLQPLVPRRWLPVNQERIALQRARNDRETPKTPPPPTPPQRETTTMKRRTPPLKSQEQRRPTRTKRDANQQRNKFIRASKCQ